VVAVPETNVDETLSASLENYLEAIHHIVAEKHAAKPRDIAKKMQVNNSSVTGALRALAERELVNYAPFDVVTLTPSGSKIAENIVRRHEALSDFFVKVLGIDQSAADESACKMEHEISPLILERFIQFVEFMELCPRRGVSWKEDLGYRCADGELSCEKCVIRSVEAEQSGAITLKDLEPGQKGTILKIEGRGKASRRLAEMENSAGSLIEVERVEADESIEAKVRGYHFSLENVEAEGILVKPL
jgi:DtxR family Mn-dependent transcriptional regulator